MYSMGDEADNIIRSLRPSRKVQSGERPVQLALRSETQRHIQRAKFNMCKQEEGESVDAFVTGLYALAEHC